MAAPGDAIILTEGVYYENLVITKGGSVGKPVTLPAAHGGRATLSGAVPPDQSDLRFERAEGFLHAVPPGLAARSNARGTPETAEEHLIHVFAEAVGRNHMNNS